MDRTQREVESKKLPSVAKSQIENLKRNPTAPSSNGIFKFPSKSELEARLNTNLPLLDMKDLEELLVVFRKAYSTEMEKVEQLKARVGVHQALLDELCGTNEELHRDLEAFLDTQASEIFIGTAIDRKFQLLRQLANHAATAYDFLKADADADRQVMETLKQEVATLKNKLDASERVRGEMIQQMGKREGLRGTSPPEHLITTRAWDAPGSEEEEGMTFTHDPVNITVDKQYRQQLAANEIKIFEGGTDLDVVFKFIKTLDFHIDMLEHTFNDAQKIEYALSYMGGTVRRWAKAWRASHRILRWTDFLTAFKHRWIPDTAHIYLANKLERMELKRAEVDKFNDDYRTTLQLLDEDDLTKIKESNQYYKTYHGKIRDTDILSALRQYSLQIRGGLNLELLMDYTSKLMLAKPASKPQNPEKQKEKAKPNHQRGLSAKDPITINTVEASTNNPEVHAMAAPRSGGYTPRFEQQRTYTPRVELGGDQSPWSSCVTQPQPTSTSTAPQNGPPPEEEDSTEDEEGTSSEEEEEEKETLVEKGKEEGQEGEEGQLEARENGKKGGRLTDRMATAQGGVTLGLHNLPSTVRSRHHRNIYKNKFHGLNRATPREIQAGDEIFVVHVQAVEAEQPTLPSQQHSAIRTKYEGLFEEPTGEPPPALPRLRIQSPIQDFP
ncbi:hypothetical protein BJ508DRAFT_310028 [Ascobolus immersus RN42]|uniref:Ty3 transposon capsid-like protein domain-containing protein n=1 Tax=Ascobolus immersus RN42 TaxID=1160509 RepID=A0A3N4HWJ3_ASCIM|nr:hypothetical protein BJ508DRAFT_310028 [Ascobolus immersus RN42]